MSLTQYLELSLDVACRGTARHTLSVEILQLLHSCTKHHERKSLQ